MEKIQDYNGWNEWAKYVLKSIERLELNICNLESKRSLDKDLILKEVTKVRDDVMTEVSKIRNDVTSLKEEVIELNTSFKIKSGIWGAVAGITTFISIYIIQILSKKVF